MTTFKTVRFPGGYSPWDTRGECSFDGDAAADAVRFFYGELKHVKGKLSGKPLALEAWQANIIATLFGWRRKDKTRRYRTAYIEIPRKAGKSTLASGIALLLLYYGNEPGAEIYSCASDRDQAAIVFEIAKANVLLSPKLDARSKIYQRSIVHYDPKTGVPKGSYKVLSAEAASKHGYNPSAIIFDELHAQPNRDLWDVMKTGTGARTQPLIVALTTAGYDRNSICWEVRQQAIAVRDGLPNESILPVIYGAEMEDDWQSEDVWRKAQPNLGVSVPLSFYRDECENAKQSPAFENTFRRLYLNQWTEQAVRWIPMEKWRACGGEPIDVQGMDCCGGLDLSTTTDITAFVLAFRLPDGRVYLEPHFWIPRDNATKRGRADGVDYQLWAKQHHVTLTDGNVVDYDVVRRDINELGQRYNIREIAVDRWNAAQITTQLTGDGFAIYPHGQGYASMSPSAKEFEKVLFGNQLAHPKNPVLDWMAANVAVEQDAAGNLKPSKKVSTERIDGIVGAVMAVGRLAASEGPSVYESRGIIELGPDEPQQVETVPPGEIPDWTNDPRFDEDD
jgi:phage terminase large subunit-like protein